MARRQGAALSLFWYHIIELGVRRSAELQLMRAVARPAGLEPATYGLEGRCTIRLCYGRRARSIPFLAGLAKSSQPQPFTIASHRESQLSSDGGAMPFAKLGNDLWERWSDYHGRDAKTLAKMRRALSSKMLSAVTVRSNRSSS